MIPAHLLPHTVARVRPSSSTNAHNDVTLTYTVPPATSTDIAAWLQQDNQAEPIQDGRQPQIRDWLMITNEQDVVTTDRIVFESLTFEVNGPPAPAYTPAGFHHLEVKLRLVEG